ncbi:MAG: hypothetical protein GY715_09360 [Planctomycetes bacterium]|nr:hypothetical protein [Planctomycetota bacterium]
MPIPRGGPGAVARCATEGLRDGDVIVYTAHQDWLSRIYLLRPDGSVINYFHYDFYYFADVEVVDGEVYLAEAFAPRVLRLDLDTGDLDVVVDDWSLYYFYDVACDGTYFYVKEWDLNRYELDGTYAGTASCDEFIAGGAYDGRYYWTLNDENLVRCWDLSTWPTMTEIVLNQFAPPSPACRGLWYDGSHFWSAENVEGALGWIYRFDAHGQVVDQWLEPAFQGWAACLVRASCPEDLDDSGDVGFGDILAVIGAWGPCPPGVCPEDLSGNGEVDFADILLVIGAWGECE